MEASEAQAMSAAFDSATVDARRGLALGFEATVVFQATAPFAFGRAATAFARIAVEQLL